MKRQIPKEVQRAVNQHAYFLAMNVTESLRAELKGYAIDMVREGKTVPEMVAAIRSTGKQKVSQ